jgi:hypothetical protein
MEFSHFSAEKTESIDKSKKRTLLNKPTENSDAFSQNQNLVLPTSTPVPKCFPEENAHVTRN